MGSGNLLLKRLARDGDERPAPPPTPARAWGAAPSVAALAADRALLLVALTLVSGVLAWWFLTTAPRDSWQAENASLIGLGAFTVVVAVMLTASVKPLAHPVVACLFALAQGVLFASVDSAFEDGILGLFGSVLLGSTLTTLCALVLRRAPGLPVPVRIALGAAGGLAALVVVNAVVELDLFAPPVPWFAWAATVVFAVVAAYSVHADLRLVDAFATADDAGQRVWAAALGLTAGLSGMYVWRFLNLRARDSTSPSSADSGSDWGSGSGSDSGSDSGGSSSD